MYTQDENGNVVLTMMRDDFDLLLLTLGYATAVAAMQNSDVLPGARLVALLNRLNEGNPHYRPYAVNEESE